MRTDFVPTPPRAAEIMRLEINRWLAVGRSRCISWRGGWGILAPYSRLEGVSAYHLTIRTPEGMLVTYKPKRKP